MKNNPCLQCGDNIDITASHSSCVRGQSLHVVGHPCGKSRCVVCRIVPNPISNMQKSHYDAFNPLNPEFCGVKAHHNAMIWHLLGIVVHKILQCSFSPIIGLQTWLDWQQQKLVFLPDLWIHSLNFKQQLKINPTVCFYSALIYLLLSPSSKKNTQKDALWCLQEIYFMYYYTVVHINHKNTQ